MATIVKDLGVATAYGYAKSKGYTGTETEFAELMASYGTVAEEAAASAEAAAGSADEAEAAQGKAEDAQAAAEAAQTAAETAQGKAEDAQEAAEAVQSSVTAAKEAAEAAQGKAETAQGKAEAAQTAAEGAADAAALWVTGETGGTPGATNNAQYYAGQASGSAATAGISAGNASGSAVAASASADSASANALKAEGYAVGKQNGTDVGDTSPYYHDNASYHAAQAAGSATSASESAIAAAGSANSASGSAGTAGTEALKAEGFAEGKQNGAAVGSDSPYYHANAAYHAGQAAGSATTAGQQATAASGSADSASASALKAEGFAVGEQNGTAVASGSPYYENNAEYFKDQAAASATHCDEVAASIPEDYTAMAEDVAELQEQIQTKAEIDGYYDSMTVGNAEQIVSTVGVDDNAPYLFRTAGGSADIGDRVTEKLVGGTVAWNQLLSNGNFASTASWWTENGTTSFSASNNVLTQTIAGGSSLGAYKYGIYHASAFNNANHKHLVCITVKPSVATTFKIELGGSVKITSASVTANARKFIYGITEANSTNKTFVIYPFSAVDYTTAPAMTVEYSNAMIIDLTQMFGSTIADYIYGLETANAGDGLAFFRKLFPKGYYAYDAGSLQSVKAASHRTTGLNQWDEEWELGSISNSTGENQPSNEEIRSKNYIPVVPNAWYYFKSTKTLGLRIYKADKTFIVAQARLNQKLQMQNDAYYIRFVIHETTTYNHDVCINLHWDGERDGEYEPYDLHEYALGDVDLRGMVKLDANNDLYYDGDTYESDGTVTRKYGIVDLGTLNWTKETTTGSNYRFASSGLSGVAVGKGASAIANLVCSKYTTVTPNDTYSNKTGICLTGATGAYLYVCDSSYSDAATFKTAMSGVHLIYELVSKTTEASDPFAVSQIVNDFGTEEYVDRGVSGSTRDVSIPVGHESHYQGNLRAKLEMAPDSPSDGDDDYVVRQTSGENEYIQLSEATKIKAMDDTIAHKADVDGYYETLTAGNSEQLVSNVGVEDQVPYNFRTAGGSANIGDRLVEKIVGGTVAWNQLVTTNTNPVKTKTGSVVTVTDAVSGNAGAVVANIEPVQDLHGYDRPWPAGGGKNLAYPSKTVAETVAGVVCTPETDADGNVISYDLHGTTNATGSFIPFRLPVTDTDKTYRIMYVNYTSVSNVNKWGWDNADHEALSVGSATLTVPANHNDSIGVYFNATGIVLNHFKLQFIAVEESESTDTFAPYSNICPITGWTGAEIKRQINEFFVQSENMLDGYIAEDGTINTSDERYCHTKLISAPYPSHFIITGKNSSLQSNTKRIHAYDGNGNWMSQIYTESINPSQLYSFSFDTPEGCKYIAFSYIKTDTDVDVQVERNTYNITFPSEAGTVYGGTVDPVAGTLVVDRASITLDGTENWKMHSTQAHRFYVDSIDIDAKKDNGNCVIACCNQYKPWSYNSVSAGNNLIGFGWIDSANMRRLALMDYRYTDADDLKAYFASNNLQIVCELETPVTYSLTAQQIAMLTGENNVWADSGDVTLTYTGTQTELTTQSGRKYLTKLSGVWGVTSGNGSTVLIGNKGTDMIFDLTQMMGSSVADYVASLESGTAGAGVSWFRKLFPKEYYAYDAGTLMSVQAKEHKTVGFNAWDEEWELGAYNTTTGAKTSDSQRIRSKNMISVTPSTGYYFRFPYSVATYGYYLFQYDSNGQYIEGSQKTDSLVTLTSQTHYITFCTQPTYGTTYNNDICINLHWDGERDGEYEAYTEHVYPLGDVELRGIPKLDANNSLYYDGDTYESDGTVTRRYGIVDLGTLTYNKSVSGLFYSNNLVGTIKNGVNNAVGFAICNPYVEIPPNIIMGPSGTNPSPNLSMAVGTSGQVYFNNISYSETSEFKTAMSGVYLVYRLAESTTASSDPFQSPQAVDDFGTEEYTDRAATATTSPRDVAIPVGHESFYQANLRAKLEMLPDSPDGNGDYILRQTSGQNEFVPLVKELPAFPEDNGTYYLICTVDGSTKPLSWGSTI